MMPATRSPRRTSSLRSGSIESTGRGEAGRRARRPRKEFAGSHAGSNDPTRMKVAFISGTSIVNSDLFASWAVKTVETAYGPVTYKSRGDHVLINRHGYGFPLPPHSINYRANIRALADLGFQDIVSLNSV